MASQIYGYHALFCTNMWIIFFIFIKCYIKNCSCLSYKQRCIPFSCTGYHYFKNKIQTHCTGFVAYSQQDFLKGFSWVDFSPVPFSRSVMSNSLRPQGLQNAGPPCPSPTPRACSDSCPLRRWCHPTTLSSVVHFCFQSFSATGSFPVSQFFASGGQTIGVSASASVFPMNVQNSDSSWFPLGWTAYVTTRKTIALTSPDNSTLKYIFGDFFWSI